MLDSMTRAEFNERMAHCVIENEEITAKPEPPEISPEQLERNIFNSLGF